MEAERQVCSVESSKRLKELGVKQESLFYWEYYELNGWTVNWCELLPRSDKCASAYTAAELGEMLPDNCYTQKESDSHYKTCISDLDKVIKKWICHRIIDKNEEDLWVSKTEADARAKMLIHLIENDLVSEEWKNKWLVNHEKI